MSGPTTDWIDVELDAVDEDGDPRGVSFRLLDGVVEVEGFDHLTRLSVSKGVAVWTALRDTLAPVMDPLARPAPEPLCRGTVADAGGGRLGIRVHRDTEEYPAPGTKVTLHRETTSDG